MSEKAGSCVVHSDIMLSEDMTLLDNIYHNAGVK